MKKRDWKSAVDKFLEKWKNRNDFQGAILSGSYAVDYQTGKSDIDIMIVSSDKTKWERGNVVIDGFLIEYISDPTYFWEESFKSEFNSRRKVSINMFALGKILVDKNGEVTRLKRKAEELMKKPFKKMSQREIEMAKYYIYSGIDELRTLENDGFSRYAPVYYLHLSNILKYYANFKGISIPAPAKVYQFLNDKEFREKYKLEGFDDAEFVRLYNNGLKNYLTLEAIEQLTSYVLNKLGGFNVDGWSLSTEIETTSNN